VGIYRPGRTRRATAADGHRLERAGELAGLAHGAQPVLFKFVRDQDFTPGDPFVLKGMYVPADYLRRALADGSLRTGSRTGFEVTYANTRHLPREVFVTLVRRGFAGTTKAGSEAVLEVAAERAQTHEVVLAIRSERSEASTKLPTAATALGAKRFSDRAC
jgi:hypothetical protein